jgi:hypothetical protein
MGTRRNPADLVEGAIRSNTALRDWHPMRRSTDMSLARQASWTLTVRSKRSTMTVREAGSGIAWRRQIFSGRSNGEGAPRVMVGDNAQRATSPKVSRTVVRQGHTREKDVAYSERRNKWQKKERK